ncbi:ATP-binding protein [Aliiglaciecola sp. CAU 1673]|uniref:PAS domain-containing hybrid sensor histidine kinase/response regulator n=1 Tax=Aliiglaciecola sp. CAU 1673 TaxID=3032595 RepID=UPI0023DB2303|nr:hybrid sensor histidine kinase/response regulator [Aliiglaciecola sp. CAU 1673]MDF2177389.1 ATP-binding protein [Aliiglaciecola sp. CAU 1673]
MQPPSTLFSTETEETLVRRIHALELALQQAQTEHQALQRYSHLFQRMQHEVHIWELIYHPDRTIKTWRLLDANDMALKAWGKSLSDVIGRVTDDIFETEATRQFLPIVNKIFSENKPHSWESYFESTDQYLGMTSIPCDGYFISVGVDITAIKKRENMHRDTALKLQEAISAGNVGLWDWDLETNDTFFSPEWKAQLGYQEHEVENQFDEWQKRVHPDDLEQALKVVKHTLETRGDSHEQEFRLRHKDGSYRWIMAHASLLKNEQGEPLRMVGSHIDITNQKKMEEAILQQQKMQALGTLAGGIAHDFNNLLTPMLGYAQLLKLSLTEQGKESGYLDQLEKSATRAKELVQQILLVSREPSKPLTHVEPVYLNKLLAEVTGLLKTTTHQNIKVKQDVDDSLPAIGANASEIHRVLLNICTNAIQSMPQGGDLRISLGLAKTGSLAGKKMGKSDFICLQVSDTGCGMDKETQKRIFEPFFTTKDKGTEKGTGLGLAIVANVMKQHGGRVEVSSELGKGSCFTLYFPIIPSGYVPPRMDEHLEKCCNIEGILLLEDETDLCKLGHTLLSKLGYKVSTFQSAEKAFRHLQEHSDEYQLIITDYAMPEMSGVEFIDKVRRSAIQTPILVMTGFTNMVSEENRIKWGCQGLISKPYTIKELKQAIADVCDAQSSG